MGRNLYVVVVVVVGVAADVAADVVGDGGVAQLDVVDLVVEVEGRYLHLQMDREN